VHYQNTFLPGSFKLSTRAKRNSEQKQNKTIHETSLGLVSWKILFSCQRNYAPKRQMETEIKSPSNFHYGYFWRKIPLSSPHWRVKW